MSTAGRWIIEGTSRLLRHCLSSPVDEGDPPISDSLPCSGSSSRRVALIVAYFAPRVKVFLKVVISPLLSSIMLRKFDA